MLKVFSIYIIGISYDEEYDPKLRWLYSSNLGP